MLENLTFVQTRSQQVVRLFWQMEKNGRLHRLWAWITHRPTHLLDLDETLCCTQVQNSHYTGVHTVNINCIRGSLGKSDAFDGSFYPVKDTTRSRWVSIASEKLRGHELPPIELVAVDGVCYVRDGHHRISVARSLGQSFIDAEITEMNLACQVCE